MCAKNLADASLSCAGTIVWSSTIGMAMSLEWKHLLYTRRADTLTVYRAGGTWPDQCRPHGAIGTAAESGKSLGQHLGSPALSSAVVTWVTQG
jgi:hypothetical protein